MRSPQLLVVQPDSPYRTLSDLIAGARATPGKLTLANVGPASAAHIAFESFKRRASVEIIFVPYPGTVPAINALLGGYVTTAIASYPNVAELIRTGKLRALAVASANRIEQMSSIPTTAESGFGHFVADIWFGVVAPAKTPASVVAERAAWFTTALQKPVIKSKLSAQGLFPVSMCGSDFAAFIRQQYDTYGRGDSGGEDLNPVKRPSWAVLPML